MAPNDYSRKTIFIYYHFLPPDEVVSAKHFGDLAAGLAKRGWRVVAITSNRVRHNHTLKLPTHAQQDGYEIIRIWRPAFNVARAHGRILAAAWMIASWMMTLMFFNRRFRPSACLFGTDPILSILLAPWIKFVSRRMKVATWYFDVYPDALVADRIIKASGAPNQFLTRIERIAWKHVDLFIDLGHCMRSLLQPRAKHALGITVYPWSLLEPSDIDAPDPSLRQRLFHDAKIGFLYSGNLGHAHEFAPCLKFMSRFDTKISHLHFACRGAKLSALQIALTNGNHANISVGPLVPEDQLVKHLTSTDIHVVTLADDWTGIVVPSKAFGALAVGRPVLYFGPLQSEIAQIIIKHKVGWVVQSGTEDAVANEIQESMRDSVKWHDLTVRCFKTYRQFCSHGNTASRKLIKPWQN